MKKANKFVLIAAAPLLAAVGVGLSPAAEAAFCTDPANQFTGPFTQFLLTGSCTVSGNTASGTAVGRNAGGGLPKRLCADLDFGRRATASGFSAINGGQINGCNKHDSTAGDGEVCDTTDCGTANFHLLTVHDFN